MSVTSQGSQAFLPLRPSEKSIKARATCKAPGKIVAINGLTFPCGLHANPPYKTHKVSTTLESCNFVVCKEIKCYTHDDTVARAPPPPYAQYLQERQSFCGRQSQRSFKALSSLLESFAAVGKQTCWCKRFCCLSLSASQVTSPLSVLMTGLTIAVMWLMLGAPTIARHACHPFSGHL